MRRLVIPFALFAFACVASTSVTRTGTGLFAPRENTAEEEEAPRGLTLSVESIASDGTVTLALRNYSQDRFVFTGTQDRPRLVFEVRSGNTFSRHNLMTSVRAQTTEVPAGERIQLKANVGGAPGRVRIGIRSQEFGYTVWTSWIAP
jgi:hypothetical protein